MKKLHLIPVLFIAVSFLSFSGSANLEKRAKGPITVFTQNESFDIDLNVLIPCTGETVHLEGKLHALFHVTINGNNFVFKDNSNPQGITGVSSVSGTQYHATGVTGSVEKGSQVNGQYSFTYINNFRIIGQGRGNNLLVHENVHVTINANNTVTAEVDNLSIECR